jgi:transposase
MHKKGRARLEQQLLPAALEDYVKPNNPVRAVDAFVDGLNLKKLGFKHSITKAKGRPPYDPADLLKLFIYGYMKRIPSTRRLERESQVNIEVKWLIGDLTPDFKTIARFRSENSEPIEKVFERLVEIGVRKNFLSRLVAVIDGSRFKGVNSIDRVFSREKLDKKIEKTKQLVREYIKQIEEMDQQEEDPESFTEEELQEKIKEMKEELKKLQDLEEKIEETGASSISATDPDSRLMKIGSKTLVGYNVQTAVDPLYKLITAFNVTNDRADTKNLYSMALKASKAVENPKIAVLTDTGYYDFNEIHKCVESGILPYMREPKQSENPKVFPKKCFIYDSEKDQYKCPADQQLTFKRNIDKGNGRILRSYRTSACRSCSIKAQCTKSQYGRSIERHPFENDAEAMAERVKKRPKFMRSRRAIIEHVFGCLKSAMNLREFHSRGFEKVRTEFSLAAVAFNLIRLINIFGTERLILELG